MWLLPVRTMLRLYAKETRPKINDHEWLKRKGHLVDWKSLDRSDIVIFVSHEWARHDHGDPEGVQIGELCRTRQCRKRSVAQQLRSLLDAKVDYLFVLGDIFRARMLCCQRVRWLRGLASCKQKEMKIKTFSKNNLKWSKKKSGDGKYFDCNGVSLLIYALMWSNDSMIQEAIDIAVSVDELESRIKISCPSIGLFGSLSLDHVSMGST